MAKFKCQNCWHKFEKFCDREQDSKRAMCPNCGSHWTRVIGEKDSIQFPRLPYTDPSITPVPYKPTINRLDIICDCGSREMLW